MSKITIIPNLERKQPQFRQARKNVFSDETNLYLLRLLRKETALPDTLGNAVARQHDLQLELAAAIRQRVLPWFWSILLHALLLTILAFLLFPVIRSEPLDILSGMVNIPSLQDIQGTPGHAEGNAPSIDNTTAGTPEI